MPVSLPFCKVMDGCAVKELKCRINPNKEMKGNTDLIFSDSRRNVEKRSFKA
jgi:hypothetical protein